MTDVTFAWREICAAYADRRVGELCLNLQDRFAVDVPLLLFLAVADRGNLGPDDDALAEFIRSAATWREEVIAPIRAMRKAMKGRFTAPPETNFRNQVKRLEVEAEHQHVRRLAEAWRPCIRRTTPAVATYLNRCGLAQDEIDRVLGILWADATHRKAAGRTAHHPDILPFEGFK